MLSLVKLYLGVGKSSLNCMVPLNMNSISYFDAFHHSPDKEIKYEYKKKNREDPPGVDINLLDLSEAVALVWLILQLKYVFGSDRSSRCHNVCPSVCVSVRDKVV